MSERKLWNVTERSHSITLKYYARSLPFSGGHKEVGKRKCLLDFSILGFRLCDELWRQCITEGMESKIATAAPNHEQRPVSALTFRTASSQWSSRSKELPSLNAAYNSTVDDQEERDAASIHPQTREGGAATTTSDINNVSFSEYEDLLVRLNNNLAIFVVLSNRTPHCSLVLLETGIVQQVKLHEASRKATTKWSLLSHPKARNQISYYQRYYICLS